VVNVQVVADAALKLSKRDDASLEVLIAMRENAIKLDAELENDPLFEPKYDEPTMGGLDDLKALGQRIVARWNKELYGAVCGQKQEDGSARQTVLSSLNLDEAAVVAAVATALLTLGVAAALAAAIAPIIVRRFVWPAKDELCAAWGERLEISKPA
jgi:hypothetical protein